MKIGIHPSSKYKFLLLLFVLFTKSFIQAQTTPTYAVGNTSVSADVGAMGNATATIPIYCPPARLGIKPSINLTFNSQGNSGVLGKGWNLSGMSVITRIGKNWHLDNGMQDAVKLENVYSENLSIDGQKMYYIDDRQNQQYYFRTEQDVFSKITYHVNGNGYFEVDLKGGGKAFYGLINNSRHVPIGSQETLAWYICRSYDKNGNYIEYDYDNSDGQIFLSEIRYGGYDCSIYNTRSCNWTSQPSYNKIKFTPQISTHTSQQYVAGYEVKQNKIVSKIETFTNNTTIVRTYDMVYETDNISTRLIKVSEQVDANNKLHPVDIKWNEDEINDKVRRKTGTYSNCAVNHIKRTGDFNGDGKADILIINGELDPFQNKFLNKSNTFSISTFDGSKFNEISLIGGIVSLPYDNISAVLVGDVDADGDDDILFQTASINLNFNTNGTITHWQFSYDKTYNYHVFQSNVDKISQTLELKAQNDFYPSRKSRVFNQFFDSGSKYWQISLFIPFLVEADGDGLLDLLENECVGDTYSNNNQNDVNIGMHNNIHIYLSTLLNEPNISLRYYNHPFAFPKLDRDHFTPMDFNGNGKTDFMFTYDPTYNILVGQPNGFPQSCS
jgi:hypothetical protein